MYMKKYEQITEEELVDKILHAERLKDIGFGLYHMNRQKAFNEYWNINISSLVIGFKKIQDMIKNLEYLNEELICDFCGKHFLRKQRNALNKSGRNFCSDLCSKRFSSRYGNTKEKQKQKSETIKHKIIIGEIKIYKNGRTSEQIKYDYKKNPKLCEYCNQPIIYSRRFYKTCCKEHGLLLRNLHNHEIQLIRHTTGGKRSHSGRGKQGRYHGIWCDSSWELAWVIYQEEHQIKFKKYHGYFEYEFEGIQHKYYPDFELEDGTIVEIKGYWSKQWQAKLDQFPKGKKLQILGKNEMVPILKYVKTKYGNDFIQLYE